MKRYGSLFKVYERVGKSVFLVSKEAQKDCICFCENVDKTF